jgi:predicted amidophosphoribosyltransferase
LNLEERKENVHEAFEIPGEQRGEVLGKKVILVDDVITTGSTVLACAHEFIGAGTGLVLAVSAAVAE